MSSMLGSTTPNQSIRVRLEVPTTIRTRITQSYFNRVSCVCKCAVHREYPVLVYNRDRMCIYNIQ